MKLLRLRGENGNYEANFMEDIYISKDSKICLRNLSFKRTYDALVVDSNNKTITVSTSGEQDITFDLTERTYNQFDISDFIEELINKLNNNIIITNDGSYVGLQFGFNLSSSGFQLISRKAPVIMDRSFVNLSTTSANLTMNAQNRISKIQGQNLPNTPNPDRLYFNDNIRFTKGSGVFACKIGILGNDADNNNGFFIGLSDAPNASGHILYNIEIRSSNLNYTSIKNGEAIVTSAVAPQNFSGVTALEDKDILEIRKDDGKIIGTVRQVAGSTELFSHTLTDEDIEQDLFPVFGVYGSFDNARISLPRITFDPFIARRINFGKQSLSYSNNIATVLNSVVHPPEKTMTLNLPNNVNKLLNLSLNSDTDDTLWLFSSQGPIQVLIEDENYLVESLSVDLESFESTRQRRMNILATIPFENKNNGVINYEPNERLCVSIKNNFDLTLRNFKFRVLDKDLNTIKTTGSDVMTILIEDKNE